MEYLMKELKAFNIFLATKKKQDNKTKVFTFTPNILI